MIKKNFMAIDKEKPLVSIFCLTYNHAPYIRQCLDGFLMQKATFTYEVIINDDASTDGTTEIIREYEEKYPDIIKPIYHEENLYSKGERGFWQKYCFPKSKGKYIALCEGDDYWTDPYKLQKQVDLLENNMDCSLCSGGYISNKGGIVKEVIEYKGAREYFVFDLYDWLDKWLTKTLTVVFRAVYMFEYVDYISHFSHSRDIYLFYFLLNKGMGIYVPKILGVYNVHDAGVCSMIPKSQNVLYSYDCYKEIYLYDQSRIAALLWMRAIQSRLIYRKREDVFRVRWNLMKEGFGLAMKVRDKLKLLVLFFLPSFILELYYGK